MKNRDANRLQPDLFGYTPSLFDGDLFALTTLVTDRAPYSAMLEAAAENAANAEAWDGEEYPEEYIELLAFEAEIRDEYRLDCRYDRVSVSREWAR